MPSCAYQKPYASHTERDIQTGALHGGVVGSSIGDEKNRRQDQHRPGGAGALHAGALQRPVPPAARQGHEHPPLVPARLQGCQALPPGP